VYLQVQVKTTSPLQQQTAPGLAVAGAAPGTPVVIPQQIITNITPVQQVTASQVQTTANPTVSLPSLLPVPQVCSFFFSIHILNSYTYVCSTKFRESDFYSSINLIHLAKSHSIRYLFL
jgi:hypothetical protein